MEFRKVIRLGEKPTEIKFYELRKGDRFTLEGGKGDCENGTRVHTACSNAYPVEPSGNFAVDVMEPAN